MLNQLNIRSFLSVSVVCVLWFGLGCKSQTDTKNHEKKISTPTVMTVNYPIQFFAERIAGSLNGTKVKIEFPVDRGVDPAFWKPSSAAISKFQKADLILLNGATYAKWTEIASLPDEKTVDTSVAFKNAYIEIEEAFVHQHGPEGEHNHAGIAFTTWLDFQQAKQQAEAVRDALTVLLPDEKETFLKNFAALAIELDSLDKQMLSACKKIQSQPIVMSHPIYQYLERRYELNARSLQWEPGMVIGESELSALQKILDEHPAKLMIWEGDPGDENRKILSEKLGLKCVVFSPCFNVAEKDWLETMKQNIQNFSQ